MRFKRAVKIDGVPKGIRTPVVAVKGRCPRPLDDGDRIDRTIRITNLDTANVLYHKDFQSSRPRTLRQNHLIVKHRVFLSNHTPILRPHRENRTYLVKFSKLLNVITLFSTCIYDICYPVTLNRAA